MTTTVASWQESICRIWTGHPNSNGKAAGTTFPVGERAFLTCRHVLDALGDRATWNANTPYISGRLFDAPVRIQSSVIPHDSEILSGEGDFALLYVDVGDSVSPERVLQVVERSSPYDHSDEFEFAGFSKEAQGLITRTARIKSRYSPLATVILDAHVASGMSGAPVLLFGSVVALVKARAPAEGEVDVIPSHLFAPFLRRCEITVPKDDGLAERLELPPEGAAELEVVAFIQKFPGGPGLDSDLIPIAEFAWNLAKAYKISYDAYGALEDANRYRKMADPQKAAQSITLAPPGDYDRVGPDTFWQLVIRGALGRGPRMFAALLYSIRRDEIDRYSSVLPRILSTMQNWKTLSSSAITHRK